MGLVGARSGVLNMRGRLRGVDAGRRARPSPQPEGRSAPIRAGWPSRARSSSDRVRRTRRCGRSIPSCRKARLPRCCFAVPSCLRCSRASRRRGRSLFRPASATVSSAEAPGLTIHLAEIAALAGDHATAADHLRRYLRHAREAREPSLLSTFAALLGRSLCALGRYEEAEPLAQLGRELGGQQDFATQMLWRQVQALVHAHRGEHAEAERLAREAVAIAERTDGLNQQGDALCDLAEVLARRRPHRRGRRRARAGARPLRAQEEPRHGRASAPAAKSSSSRPLERRFGERLRTRQDGAVALQGAASGRWRRVVGAYASVVGCRGWPGRATYGGRRP